MKAILIFCLSRFSPQYLSRKGSVGELPRTPSCPFLDHKGDVCKVTVAFLLPLECQFATLCPPPSIFPLPYRALLVVRIRFSKTVSTFPSERAFSIGSDCRFWLVRFLACPFHFRTVFAGYPSSPSSFFLCPSSGAILILLHPLLFYPRICVAEMRFPPLNDFLHVPHLHSRSGVLTR